MKKSFLTLLAMVLVFGLSFIACDNGNGDNDGHTHSYGTTWSYNATQHYKQCSCGEKIDVENHAGDPCTICGYDSSTHTHSYSTTWSKNDTQHWKECSCGDKTEVANHTGDPCTICGYTNDTSPSAKYIITGSGTTFTATKDGSPVGTANSAIQTVIDDIQTDANGAKIEIQFGTGSVLDTGANGIKFNNTGGTWGVITISGKIKMSVNSSAIQLENNVSVTSTADIENNSTTHNLYNSAIVNYGTGTLTINSGTVKGTGGESGAIQNWTNGKLIVNGGTLYGYNESAILNNGTATITGGSFTSEDADNAGTNTIKNSGTMTISNAIITSDKGRTIRNEGYPGGTVTINSGTISATDSSCAVHNVGGNITIAGGTITTANINEAGGTVWNDGNAESTITITGGTINAPSGGNAVYNRIGSTTIGAGATINGNTYGVD